MGLAADVGLSRIALGIKGIEILIEPVVGGDAGVDGATNPRAPRCAHTRASSVTRVCLSRKPKKRGPFQRVPVIARATSERLRCTLSRHAKPFASTITR